MVIEFVATRKKNGILIALHDGLLWEVGWGKLKSISNLQQSDAIKAVAILNPS